LQPGFAGDPVRLEREVAVVNGLLSNAEIPTLLPQPNILRRKSQQRLTFTALTVRC
jgi:hypothetical protein